MHVTPRRHEANQYSYKCAHVLLRAICLNTHLPSSRKHSSQLLDCDRDSSTHYWAPGYTNRTIRPLRTSMGKGPSSTIFVIHYTPQKWGPISSYNRRCDYGIKTEKPFAQSSCKRPLQDHLMQASVRPLKTSSVYCVVKFFDHLNYTRFKWTSIPNFR